MPTPEVKDYSKVHLRVILANPNVDTTKIADLDRERKISKQQFYNEVLPVVTKYCQNLISLADFKKKKIVHRKVVKILFDKLL